MVTLAFQTGSTAGGVHPVPASTDFSFVLGIGTGGLTPFEYALVQYEKGGEVSLSVASTEAERFFGHLLGPAAAAFRGRGEAHFKIRILDTRPATPREIIRAMAEMTAHGHGNGCDCGCGCG
jgi:hypothetical protein